MPDPPGAVLREAGDGWRLDGEKLFVPWRAARAHRLLVPARAADGRTAVVLVDPGAGGVALEAMATTSGLPEHIVRLDDVTVPADAVLGGEGADGAEIVRWLVDHRRSGCAPPRRGCARGRCA